MAGASLVGTVAGLVRDFAPVPRLRPVVDAFWFTEVARPVRLLVRPDGCIDLIFRAEQAGGGALFASGLDLAPREAALEPGTRWVGARLRPGEARSLLGIEPSELVAAGLVPVAFSARLAAAERRLGGCRCGATLLRQLATEVESLTGRHLPPPPRVRAAIRLLGAPGPLRVAAVARELGVSPRTLHRELVAWAGLPPQVLARIFRFRMAFRRVAAGGAPLAALAADTGYADQAHMAREFRAFAGAPPSAFA